MKTAKKSKESEVNKSKGKQLRSGRKSVRLKRGSEKVYRCYVCGEDWCNETVNKELWIGCDSENCDKWCHEKCIPRPFDQKAKYYCLECR